MIRDDQRTWRIRDKNLRAGWYRFRSAGRGLEVVEEIESELEVWVERGVKGPFPGYHALGRFVSNDRQERFFGLPRDQDIERFSPVLAWEWFDGHLLFGGVEFETEAEGQVRDAFENENSITEIKGVTPALANAFLLETTTRQLRIEAALRREEEKLIRQQEAELEIRREEIRTVEASFESRLILALSHTGAALVDWRRSGSGMVTVIYRVGGQRFECVVDGNSLNIVDAGICLDGSDRELNLSSLPSAVQEAIETGQLHVFRRG